MTHADTWLQSHTVTLSSEKFISLFWSKAVPDKKTTTKKTKQTNQKKLSLVLASLYKQNHEANRINSNLFEIHRSQVQEFKIEILGIE